MDRTALSERRRRSRGSAATARMAFTRWTVADDEQTRAAIPIRQRGRRLDQIVDPLFFAEPADEAEHELPLGDSQLRPHFEPALLDVTLGHVIDGVGDHVDPRVADALG